MPSGFKLDSSLLLKGLDDTATKALTPVIQTLNDAVSDINKLKQQTIALTRDLPFQFKEIVVQIPSRAWTAPTFENSWANTGTYGGRTYNPAGYYIDPNGVVHMRGTIGSGTAATAAFTLPAGYRPPYDYVFVGGDCGGGLSVASSSAGAHTHGAATGGESAHTHSGTTDDAYGPDAHNHTFTTGAGSDHNHSISSDGAHTHTTNLQFNRFVVRADGIVSPLNSQITDVTCQFEATSPAAPAPFSGTSWPIELAAANYSATTKMVLLAQAYDMTNATAVSVGAANVDWIRLNNGNVLVRAIHGLTPERFYRLTFLLYGGN